MTEFLPYNEKFESKYLWVIKHSAVPVAAYVYNKRSWVWSGVSASEGILKFS